MDGEVHVVRIYWSEVPYGQDLREAPMSDPLEVADFPRKGDTCRIWFGPIADEIRQGVRIWMAMGNMYLNMRARGGEAGDAAVEEQLEKVEGYDNRPWYVTVTLNRPVQLDAADLTGQRYWWLLPGDELERVEDSLRTDAPAAFDFALSAMAPLLPAQMFAGREISAATFTTAPGRGPIFAPKVNMTMRGAAHRSMTSFPLDALRARLDDLQRRRTDWQSLEHAAHWYEAMRGEQDDPLRRYLWGFVALEVMTNLLYDRLYDPAVATVTLTAADGNTPPRSVVREALVQPKRQLGLTKRFAVVASYISPASAKNDIAVFRRVYKARNEIAHGEKQLTALTFPSMAMEELLGRYFDLGLGLRAA
jgi:hypothetical protein